ncbi:MAG: hypothetical protein FJW40_03265 [Acidobacteria bacterium]|nr:hypothetical protein [Acidobacteriota bacterium]
MNNPATLSGLSHDDWINLQAAEKYIFGGLNEDQRDAYEEHFFSCYECAEEVRWMAIFEAKEKKIFDAPAPGV